MDKLSARTDLDEEKYAEYAMKWIHGGASIVGGCCEVGPSHIDYLRKCIEEKGYRIVSSPHSTLLADGDHK